MSKYIAQPKESKTASMIETNLLPSPYNFVPLSEAVAMPEDLSRCVSMDVPFKDGISGTLEVRIEAKTAVMIRATAGNSDPSFFRVTTDGQYAIPGTSLRGMLRNVLEIATFSRMSRIGHMRDGNQFLAVRDLNNRPLYSGKLTETVKKGGKEFWRPRAKTGWLEIGDDIASWKLWPCKCARIHHKDLTSVYDWSFDRRTSPSGKDRDTEWSAEAKYRKWYKQRPTTKITFVPGPDDEIHSEKFIYAEAKQVGMPLSSPGVVEGQVVFTGQPSPKKAREFAFYERSQEPILLVESLVRAFKDAHSANGSPTGAWDYWLDRVKQGEATLVPVFYLPGADGKTPESMGLAQMYKLAYTYGLRQALGHVPGHIPEAGSNGMDFSDMLFGYVSDQDSLRGRVLIETAPVLGEVTSEEPVTAVLGNPKPTYYPTYMEQQVTSTEGEVATGDDKSGKPHDGQYPQVPIYKTLMDKGCRLRGWKRYPVRDRSRIGRHASQPSNCSSTFSALPARTIFQAAVHVHNLRPFELGAILWVITWGKREKLCHSIGLGKPLGYGAVKLSIHDTSLPGLRTNHGAKVSLDACLGSYEEFMQSALIGKGDWIKTDQMRELLAMADPEQSRIVAADQLDYPVLDAEKGRNDFQGFKDASRGQALLPFTKFVGWFRAKSQPHVVPKRTAPVDLSPVDQLFKRLEAGMSDSEFGKAISMLKAVTRDEYARIAARAKKRPGGGGYWKPVWRVELEKLEARIQSSPGDAASHE